MGLRAIHLFAGTGTMTRAFQKHGVDVVLAWEPDKSLAQVYRANFPEVSLVEEPMEGIDISQFPDYDLLLARLYSPPVSVRIHDFKTGEVLSVVRETRPKAFCFFITGWVGHNRLFSEQAVQALADIGYYVKLQVLDAAEFGGVPFKGRGTYVIGYRQGYAEQDFVFPERIESRPLDARYLDMVSEEEELLCRKIPEEVRIFIESENPKPGSIYCRLRKVNRNMGEPYPLISCEYCPKINQREWYRIYVQGKQKVRRLSWREYLALQGDVETRFPSGMAISTIWYCLWHHGLYTVEYRLAERLVQLLNRENDWQYEATVPLYSMVLRSEQKEELSTDTDSSQAFAMEVFKDSLWTEEGQKFLVVMENQMQAAAFCAELSRLLKDALRINPQTAEVLGIEERILRKRLAESEDFILVTSEKNESRRQIIRNFRNCKRGILVVVSMWQELDIPELSAAYVIGQRDYHDLMGIAGCITRPYAGKNYARMIFCECDYAELLNKGIIKEWPGTQKLVQALWRDDYQNGYSILKQIKAETGSVGMAMEQELRFLYPTGCSREDWHNLWRDQKESLRLLCTVWCLTSQYAGAFGKNWLGKACRDLPEMTKKEIPQEETPRELSKSKAEMQDKAGKTFTSSHEQGAFLENAVMKLLNYLFHLPQESIADLAMQVSSVLDVLRRQNSGAQGGHDICIVYLDETRKKRVCLFECKNKRVTKIKIADIVEKLELVKLAGQEVEHWILVAPCAKLANDAVSYLERLERHPGGQLPIKNVQVWGEDNGVKELFGLVPELYHAIYGGDPEDEDAPEQWTDFQRTQIREHWGQKLLPVALLPNGFLDYPEKTECLLFDVQNDRNIRKQYEELYGRYIRLHYYDDEGRYMEGTLEADLEKWLYQSRQTVKILLGEFGDGKTFFLYSFCRRLLEKFRKNPEEHYLPICFSLKRMGETKSAAEFIGERMEELGANREDFLELKKRYHVVVCLDGLDEMTAEIDSITLLSNVKRLISCCDELKDVKILITSRTQCFESYHVRDMLWERFGEFEAWKLARIPREEAKRYLYAASQEKTGGQGENALSAGPRWLPLAGKPLFIEMMRELWEDDMPIGISENTIYDRYIYKCLRRKFLENYDRKDKWVKEKDTTERIFQALQQIAVRMQDNKRERLGIKEIEAFLDMPLAKILWEEDAANERISEGARNRFSMRSLFKMEGAEEISFAHRSIREYFVGKHLLGLLEENLPGLYDLLERDICSYEVYGFLANGIVEGEREILMGRLLSLLPQCRASKSAAAAKILQVCFLVDIRIPRGEWSGQNLDGIYIPGADLSGQDLSHVSIRNSNLNNIRLDNADCSYCDFTGSRLEETKRVEAVGQNEKGVRVIYTDGVVRDWEPEHMESEICWEEPEGYERATLLERGCLALRLSGQWQFYGNGKQQSLMLRYWKEDSITILDISATGILLTWQMDVDRYLTATINCRENKVQIYQEGDRAILGKLCGENAAVISDGQKVYFWDMESGQEYAFPLQVDNPREIAARREADGYRLALLAEGKLILAGFQSGEADIRKREHHLSLEGIHHVAIVQEDRIALGSSGGTVFLIPVNWETLEMKWDHHKDLQLGIYCRNVKTEGLVPLEVRQRLEMHRG